MGDEHRTEFFAMCIYVETQLDEDGGPDIVRADNQATVIVLSFDDRMNEAVGLR